MDSPSDDEMNALLETARPYTIVILRPGPKRNMEGADSIVWEHGRRNMRLRSEGKLAIVMPVGDSEVSGLGIFRADLAEATSIMANDPGVRAGVFVAEFHSGVSFPGDKL